MNAEQDRLREVDPEAFADVDFSRHLRVVGRHWWVIAAGSVLGAIIGFALAVGHGSTFRATATVFLGLPYATGGAVALQSLQTNSSVVDQIIHSLAIDGRVGLECHTHSASFRSGISAESGSGGLRVNGQALSTTIAVLAPTARISSCAADGLARAAVSILSPYARSKIAGYRSQITDDQLALADTEAMLASRQPTALSALLLKVRLEGLRTDLATAHRLLQQAEQVELPRILTRTSAEPVSARTRRASSLIGGLLGALLSGIVLTAWAVREMRSFPAEL